MSLFFSKASAGSEEIVIDEEEIQEELFYWKYTLVGTTIGLRSKLNQLREYVEKTWNHIIVPLVQYFKKGWFCFRFNSKEAMDGVLRGGPWYLGKNALLLQRWSPIISQDLECISVIPVWVLLPGLDPLFWSPSMLSKIASTIDTPLFDDCITTTKKRLGFARLMVEVDVSQPLVENVIINTPFSDGMVQPVEYEWVPYFCKTCKKLGHESSKCKLNKEKMVRQVYRPVQTVLEPVEGAQVMMDKPVEKAQVKPVEDAQQKHGVNQKRVIMAEPVRIDTGVGQVVADERQMVTTHALSLSLKQVKDGYQRPGSRITLAITLIGLLETRVKEANASRVLNKFPRFTTINNYSAHYNGRIWVLWQAALLDVTVLMVAAQLVHLKVFCKLLNTSFNITIVYGFNDGVSRKLLWHDLMGLAPSVDLGWLVLGDFNIVRTVEDKIRRHPPVGWEMMDFNGCLNWCSLDELHFQCGPFIWTNNQDGDDRGWSRLDWAFVNPLWLQSFSDSIMRVLPSGTSDQSPLLVSLWLQVAILKSFKFLNCWIANEHFPGLVSSAWETMVTGTPAYKLFAKLKKVKYSLGQLHKDFYSSLSIRVNQCYSDLLVGQSDLLASPLNCALMEKVAVLKQRYYVLKKAELSMLAQRAKINHLKLSDSNTAYFYAAVATRRHLSVVGSIVDHHGQSCSSPTAVATAFYSYYQSLLGTANAVTPLNLNTLASGYCLNATDAEPLSAPVSPDEIKAALFSMGSNKSPGIDGFSVEFFKASWNVISRDFYAAVQDYFKHGKLLRYAATTVITLLPKKASACSVLDYRPISCCTVFYKVVAKVLVNRLKDVLPLIVGHEQAAFVADRNIFHNVMVSQALVKGYDRQHVSPRALVKVDIR
ncbi:hypothetical protein RND81_02G161900 [Saponaria officinalis]|uniref:DUF4283 domain-containing protein n=1 Tax=Saponaria officinalis TaxID=3572 RepID=A0AAW1MN60_SAPOF